MSYDPLSACGTAYFFFLTRLFSASCILRRFRLRPVRGVLPWRSCDVRGGPLRGAPFATAKPVEDPRSRRAGRYDPTMTRHIKERIHRP